MNIQGQIKKDMNNQPESKRAGIEALHGLILQEEFKGK
jgi:hypothetical protein